MLRLRAWGWLIFVNVLSSRAWERLELPPATHSTARLRRSPPSLKPCPPRTLPACARPAPLSRLTMQSNFVSCETIGPLFARCKRGAAGAPARGARGNCWGSTAIVPRDRDLQVWRPSFAGTAGTHRSPHRVRRFLPPSQAPQASPHPISTTGLPVTPANRAGIAMASRTGANTSRLILTKALPSG